MKSVSKNLNSNISQQLFYLLVLVLFLRVDLVFENNTPTGGDMGAHIVAIDTFIKDFMPNLQINGWSNDWFGGYPLYYFCLLYTSPSPRDLSTSRMPSSA